MSCPACHQPLAILELEGIEIDHCLACAGTWLDAGELETIAVRAGAPVGELTKLLSGASEDAKGERRCVRCRAKMRVARLGADDPVTIDRCPRGHGLWFDAGEIRHLLKTCAQGEETEALSRFLSESLRSRL